MPTPSAHLMPLPACQATAEAVESPAAAPRRLASVARATQLAATPGTGQPWHTFLLRQARWIVPLCLLFGLSNEPRPWQHPLDYAIAVGYSLVYFVGLSLANNLVAVVLDRYLSWGEQPMRRLLLTLGLSLLASLLVIVVVTEGLSALLWHNRLGQATTANLTGQLFFPLLVTVVISLFLHSRSFLLSWREATVRAERLEKESAVARLDSLRRQVDPHFLFNSLNALTSLVEEEPGRAVRFIRQLSQVYRYVLESQAQELVPLGEELAFAEAYVFLQQTRLGDALRVEMPETGGMPATYYLPPLALQLLLENALKHNTAFQGEPLRLLVELDAAAATLTVRNTLRPRRLAAGEVSGRGLANLRARYAFLTARPVEAGPVAHEFVVTLPLLTL